MASEGVQGRYTEPSLCRGERAEKGEAWKNPGETLTYPSLSNRGSLKTRPQMSLLIPYKQSLVGQDPKVTRPCFEKEKDRLLELNK